MSQLVQIDVARKALAIASSIEDVLDIRDKAEAIRHYYQKRDGSLEAMNLAAELKLRAERKLGELLRDVPREQGKRPDRTSCHAATKLQELHIKPTDSSRWQRIAAVPEAQFEQHLAEAKAKGEVTTAGALELAIVLEREARHSRRRSQLEEAGGNGVPEMDDFSWRVTEGDCLDELRKVRDGSVRLAFADPPYNQGVDYGAGDKADRLSDADYLLRMERCFGEVARSLAPDGSFWVLISDEYADEFALRLTKAGLSRRQWLIWYESFGMNNDHGFGRTSRHLLWYVKDRRRVVFHPEAVRRDSDRKTKYRDQRARPEGRTWDSVWGVNPPIPRLTGTCSERLPDFPTQLPLALLLPIVGCASDPDDLVLDPYSGTATTGVAALQMGRRYLGMEKNPDYVHLSRLRLKAAVKRIGEISNGQEET